MIASICVNCGNDKGHYSVCMGCLAATDVPHGDGVLLLTVTLQELEDFALAAVEHGLSLRDWVLGTLREEAHR